MKKLVVLISVFAIISLSCQKNIENTSQACCSKENSPMPPALSGISVCETSVYGLPGKWTDQNNNQAALNNLEGKVQVVAMIFTHCGYACPRTIDNMKAIASRLPANEKDNVGFVLVSFDPERDSPQQLKAYAITKQLDSHWTLLHGSADQIRELSLLLDLQYDQQPDGNFSHSNAITILDKQGIIVKRLEGLTINPAEAATAITTLAN